MDDEERPEVYERIPWETLESRGSDRQWFVYAVAGAVALGALAYSFMRNQPTAPPPQAVVTTTVSGVTTTPPSTSTSVAVASPVVVTEADLFAVEPERLIDQALTHAEWFAVEYMSFDGSEQSSATLVSLLPVGVPPPTAPEGTQVYVDWVGARSVTQTGPLTFDVEVLVRSLVSDRDDSGFIRQPTRVLTVPIEIGDDGAARVTGVPSLDEAVTAVSAEMTLVEVPQELLSRPVLADADVVGGMETEDGSWEVVVIATGTDGVRRPVTVRP